MPQGFGSVASGQASSHRDSQDSLSPRWPGCRRGARSASLPAARLPPGPAGPHSCPTIWPPQLAPIALRWAHRPPPGREKVWSKLMAAPLAVALFPPPSSQPNQPVKTTKSHYHSGFGITLINFVENSRCLRPSLSSKRPLRARCTGVPAVQQPQREINLSIPRRSFPAFRTSSLGSPTGSLPLQSKKFYARPMSNGPNSISSRSSTRCAPALRPPPRRQGPSY